MNNTDRLRITQVITTTMNDADEPGLYYVTGVKSDLPPRFSSYGMLWHARSPYRLHPDKTTCVYAQIYIDVYSNIAARGANKNVWSDWKIL